MTTLVYVLTYLSIVTTGSHLEVMNFTHVFKTEFDCDMARLDYIGTRPLGSYFRLECMPMEILTRDEQ